MAATTVADAAQRRRVAAAEALYAWYQQEKSLPNHNMDALKGEYLRRAGFIDANYEAAVEPYRKLFLEESPGQLLPVFLQPKFQAISEQIQSRLPNEQPSWTERGNPEIPVAIGAPMEPVRPTPKKSGWKVWTLLAVAGVLILIVTVGYTNAQRESRAAGKAIAQAMATSVVHYEVEGTAKGVNLTLQTPSGTSQLNSKAVPLANKNTGVRGITYEMPAGSFVYLSAQNIGSSGTITCRITVNGVVVAENSSSGGYAIASCSG